MKPMKLVFMIMLSMMLTAVFAQQSYFKPDQIDIPYTRYILDNGLTLLVHEDHKAPIVAVNIWYHVGSKNEKTGRTGFAHLFEHLMFNGSENFNTDYFKALESIGGTDVNGTTNNDRTNYFQNVPVSALDQVLFLESDRMGHLLGALDQPRLDEQRGVVQNEKRQGENQPYGRSYEIITQATYPKGHPYSWTVIGLMEDLSAATLEDAKQWFRTYYGPSNAVLSIAGDIKPEVALEKVKKYFGDIPPGPSLVKPGLNIARRVENTRGYYQDMVPEARITMVWNVPQWGSREAAMLDLASDLLSSGKSSRLYKKLIYEDQTASSAYAYVDPMEISGNFYVDATIKQGKSVAEVENTINAVMKEFLENGPRADELERVKARYFSNFLKGIERIGGFGGKSDILATNEVYGGSADFYKTTMRYVAEATPEEIKKVCNEWLNNGKYVLVCEPFPAYKAGIPGITREKMPDLGTAVAATFPDLQKATLKNGLNIVLAKRTGVPTIVGQLVVNSGYSSDIMSKAGVAALSMDLLDEGTETMTSLEISDKLQLLGASVSTGAGFDASYVFFTTLKQTLYPTLDLFADVLLHPSFLQKEFDRLKKQQLDYILQEKADPIMVGLRVLPKMLYGDGHPYSTPLTGTGYESSVKAITPEDVHKFYENWFKPNNATLVVVGDVEMSELTRSLEKTLGSWKEGSVPERKIPAITAGNGKKIYLVDRPESTQSVVFSGYLITPYGQVFEPALTALMSIYGMDFTSRLNMNIREEKHWSYGAQGVVIRNKGQRPLLSFAPVQMDKTKETIQEINKELSGFNGDKPVTAAEFNKVQKNMVLGLSGMWESNSSVLGSLMEKVEFNLSDDYFKTYDSKIRMLTREELQKLCSQVMKPEQANYLVVGDKSKILESLKETGYEVIELDTDGNPVFATPSKKMD